MKTWALLPYDPDHMSIEPLGFASGLPVRRHMFAPSEPVFRVGDRVNRVYYVSAGAVRLLRPLESGERAVMHVASAGDWLAEASLFSSRYHCDALCVGRSVLMSVGKSQLMQRLASHGEHALELAHWMSMRLRELRQLHEIVRVRGAKERVMRWLQWKAEGNSGQFMLACTWSEVAEELALTREALYRSLAHLKQSGTVRVEGRHVILHRRTPALRKDLRHRKS